MHESYHHMLTALQPRQIQVNLANAVCSILTHSFESMELPILRSYFKPVLGL